MRFRRKKKEKEKKKKRKKEQREKRIKTAMLCLETQAWFEGYMAKAFKARCPKPLLVGSHRISARYMGRHVDLSKF